MKENKSKLIAESLKQHSRLKREYRRGIISEMDFDQGLLDLLNTLADLTDLFGDCQEIDYVKEMVWFTIETNYKRQPHSKPDR